MTTHPSRVIHDGHKLRFQPVDETERFHQHHLWWETCWGRSCPRIVSDAPVILRAVWINDLCPRRDAALWTRLHYSDGRRVFGTQERREILRLIGMKDGYPDHWPYEWVEISYEIEHDETIEGIRYLRFRIADLEAPYPADFLRAAEKLDLPPDRLLEIVRLHADPCMEQVVLPIGS